MCINQIQERILFPLLLCGLYVRKVRSFVRARSPEKGNKSDIK